jgi:WD40 repeat protein
MKWWWCVLFLLLFSSCSGGPGISVLPDSTATPDSADGDTAAPDTSDATPLTPTATPMPRSLIDAENAGSLTLTQRIRHSDVNALMFASDNTRLLTGSGDPFRANYYVSVWNPGLDQMDPLVNAIASVWDAAYSPDGRVVAYVLDINSQSIHGRIVDSETGQSLAILTGPGTAHCLAFSPDGHQLALGGNTGKSGDGAVWIYDTTNWEVVRTLSALNQTVRDVVFSPDGTILYSAGSDGKLRLWDTADGTRLSGMQKGKEANWIALSPDGGILASVYCLEQGEYGCAKGGVAVWNTGTGELITALPDVARSLAFSPDGSLLFSGGDFDDPLVRIRRTEDWELVGVLETMAAAIALPADGRLLATADFEEVMIWAAS